jgi:hypothetical protein
MGCVVMVAEVQTDAYKRLIALVCFDTQNPKATSSRSTPRWEEPEGSLTTGSMPQRIEQLTSGAARSLFIIPIRTISVSPPQEATLCTLRDVEQHLIARSRVAALHSVQAH